MLVNVENSSNILKLLSKQLSQRVYQFTINFFEFIIISILSLITN